jgi:hypothetical protein
VFSDELEKIINDIVHIYNNECNRDIKIDHYCDDNLNMICEIIGYLSDKRKIDDDLKKNL